MNRTSTRRERLRRLAATYVAAGAIVLVDQATKAAAISTLRQDRRVPLLGDLLGLQLAFNPGATLSLGSGATWLISLIGLGVVVVLIVAATRARTLWWAMGIGLTLGGAIGNLTDRVFAAPGFGVGHVTDFLAYGDLFIGNLADVAIGVGLAMLGLEMWVRRRPSAPRPAGITGMPSSTGTAVRDS